MIDLDSYIVVVFVNAGLAGGWGEGGGVRAWLSQMSKAQTGFKLISEMCNFFFILFL